MVSRFTFRVLRFTPRPLYFKNVTILNAGGPAGRSLRVKRKRVVAIDEPPGKNDCIIDGQGGLLIPGLINAHDHLELNTFQRLKYRDRYSHSRQWIEEIEARFDSDPALTEPRQQPLADRLLIGAIKNLLSGVTTVCHHNPLHKPLRRRFYPVRVVKEYGFCHSLFRGEETAGSYHQTNPAWPWIIHLAEGVDAEAAAEFEQLVELDLLQPNTILVHGVGLTAPQRQRLIEQGGGLIWCPASNEFLFGQTASVQALAEAGKLALGSDSRLSGEFDLLGELRVAAETGQLSPQQLFRLVTVDAARLLRLNRNCGWLTVGGPADLVLLPPPTGRDLFAAISRHPRRDLALVMQAGQPLVGDPRLRPIFEATRTKTALVQVDGLDKLMPLRLVRRLKKSTVQETGLHF